MSGCFCDFDQVKDAYQSPLFPGSMPTLGLVLWVNQDNRLVALGPGQPSAPTLTRYVRRTNLESSTVKVSQMCLVVVLSRTAELRCESTLLESENKERKGGHL